MSATTGPGPWAAVYAGYDDAGLATLANAGLVRRARKDVAAGKVEVLEQRAEGAVLSVGGARVELDARGPAGARCACPTPGACQHVVAACLWARDVGAAPVEATAAEPMEPVVTLREGTTAVRPTDQAGVGERGERGVVVPRVHRRPRAGTGGGAHGLSLIHI